MFDFDSNLKQFNCIEISLTISEYNLHNLFKIEIVVK